jgi:hypothetical protein
MLTRELREDTPHERATPTQQRLAREHAERIKRWQWSEPLPSPPKFRAVPTLRPKPILPDPFEQWLIECPTMLSASLIQRIVAEDFGMTRAQLVGRKRVANCVLARHIAMALSLQMLRNGSLMQVGRWFNRDHTTVLHARERIKEKIARDPSFAKKIEDLRATIIKATEPAL